MKIYHYHPETGEYLGEGLADESPLEPGVYLIPAQATIKEPPRNIKPSQRLAFDGENWVVYEKPLPTTPEA
jgi:hypothetical protein